MMERNIVIDKKRMKRITVNKGSALSDAVLVVAVAVFSAAAALLFTFSGNIRFFAVIPAVLALGAIVGAVWTSSSKLRGQYAELEEQIDWYRDVLDAVPFPISVTDDHMRWVFINRSFEKNLIDMGVTKDRESILGHACSAANATICGTENCGIRTLRERGSSETFFQWAGQKAKQETTELKDASGKTAGYVEVVIDLTAILSAEEYTKKEASRIAANLEKLAVGDLELDMEQTAANEYTQTESALFAGMNANLENLVGSVRTLGEEIETLKTAGLEGRLDERGDENRVEGVYREIVHGVNETFASIAEPVKAVSDFIAAIADGTADKPIENSYSGLFSTLVQNSDSVLTSLIELLTATAEMVKAGRHGDINFRSQAKLSGHYADVISGLNGIMDAVSVPLNEAGSIITKFSVNDYTSGMTGSYEGSYKMLAADLNALGERLIAVQNVFMKVARGNTELLETYQKVGKRSENDKMVPAGIAMMSNIRNLIDEAKVLSQAAVEGRLDVRGDETRFEGGYREIIGGMNRTMQAVQAPFDEVDKIMTKLSAGDLNAEISTEYSGEYDHIKKSINATVNVFNELLHGIATASSQVAAGSEQVSNAAQALSQGATEQAGTIEEIASTITEISKNIKNNAENAKKTNDAVDSTVQAIDGGGAQMKELVAAMEKIGQTSSQIDKVIKTIEDIAFQTNILALNASVEAARAGAAGKGFAVVADEVRSLAGKSSEAAKGTTALIENALTAVKNGSEIVTQTEKTFIGLQNQSGIMAKLMAEISKATDEQATAISQTSSGIDQVSSVVQTNSASAEETAASSEELSGQAVTLKQLVGKFRLKGGKAAVASETSGFLAQTEGYGEAAADDGDFGKY